MFPLVYDALAFVPQSLVGRLSDRFPRINFAVIGITLLAAAGVLFRVAPGFGRYLPLGILCLGNACTHISGAEVTLRCSGGKLSHSAIFVAGGSFGVVTGKLLAGSNFSYYAVIALVLTAIPFALFAEYYRRDADRSDNPCAGFDYASPNIPAQSIIILTVFIVLVRGYMGYGIPMSWKKTAVQTIIFYFAMGIGKAAGGFFADIFGVKRTAMVSTSLALPFLLLGDRLMLVSIIGVMFFSMTMSITLALLVSVLQKSPGLAFGLTTIGLFLGSVPIFFFRFSTARSNGIIIIILTLLCLSVMRIIIRKDVRADDKRLQSGN